MRPPFPYFGGKQKLAAEIAARLPEHSHYVEPFAGSLSVLLARPVVPGVRETVNDNDKALMTFWKVLRERTDELVFQCSLTPHSRAQRELDAVLDEGVDELELARRVWSCLVQGRSSTLRLTGWRYDVAPDPGQSMGERLESYRQRLTTVARRIQNVSLECDDALSVIARYSRSGTLLYVDPPYLGATRGWNYRTEMVEAHRHEELAEALRATNATVVLSGYASETYSRLYAGWNRYELGTYTTQGGAHSPRTEVLWTNQDLKPAPEFRFESTERHETFCAHTHCLKVVASASTGRPGKYCSTACRSKAYRARQAKQSSTIAQSV